MDKELPPDDANLGVALEFMKLLWGVNHALQSRSKRMELTLGVTGPQRLVVRILGRLPMASAGDLARHLHVHPSTLTGVLKRLETRGLLKRQNDSDDKRRALFKLTKHGEQVDMLKVGTVEAAVKRALRRIPERDVAGVANLLRIVTEELDRPDA
jgi:MarR family transcriptional regulator, organic hydroperoxide resistance regulator